jgi:hypothetical protein
VGKKPGSDETRHIELLKRLDKLAEDLIKLRGSTPPPAKA